MTILADAFADHAEPEVLQFETNAGLWRLEIDRHAFRLREGQAFGATDTATTEAAAVALEGIAFEIDRLQAFARTHSGLSDAMLILLLEAGVALETARRSLERALQG